MSFPPRITTFIPNEPDDLHCLQSCVRMIAAANGISLTLQDAERLTGYAPDLMTWPYRMLLSWAELGFEVVQMENFRLDQFIRNTDAYLTELYGAALCRKFRDQSDVDQAVRDAQACLDRHDIQFIQRAPGIEDIRLRLAEGYYCGCNVNWPRLMGKEGWNGHYVVIEDVTDDALLLQDPGLPPTRDRLVDRDRFVNAWLSDNPDMANLTCIRKRKADC